MWYSILVIPVYLKYNKVNIDYESIRFHPSELGRAWLLKLIHNMNELKACHGTLMSNGVGQMAGGTQMDTCFQMYNELHQRSP